MFLGIPLATYNKMYNRLHSSVDYDVRWNTVVMHELEARGTVLACGTCDGDATRVGAREHIQRITVKSPQWKRGARFSAMNDDDEDDEGGSDIENFVRTARQDRCSSRDTTHTSRDVCQGVDSGGAIEKLFVRGMNWSPFFTECFFIVVDERAVSIRWIPISSKPCHLTPHVSSLTWS